ncbi:MAG: 50S ribosomal protein L29 [Candidatus Hydrogenedentales bacterium]
MKPNEMREKTDEELKQMLLDKHDDLMHFRLQMATGVVDNVRSARAAKRDIARIKTIQGQRARQAGGGRS